MKDEKVLCVNRLELERKVDIYMEKIKVNEDELRNLFSGLSGSYIDRRIAEYDESHKQLIAYCIVINEKNELLTYKRKGSEARLYGLLSVGIGGHINDSDAGETLFDTICRGTIRELEEELPGITNYRIKPYGLINEEFSAVGHVHTGVVFRVDVDSRYITGYDDEIADCKWYSMSDVDSSLFELWSKLTIEMVLSPKRAMFLIFSHKLTEDQINDATNRFGITDFVYLPEHLQKIWSGLRPSGALDIASIEQIVNWLSESASPDDIVLIQGDFGAVHYLVGKAEKMKLVPVYSTTERNSTERIGEDGKVEKIHFFKHVGFRKYL